MANVGEVYFRLYGENFDPHEVTNFLALEPSRVDIKAKPVSKFSSWVLSLGRTEEPVYDVYEKSETLLKLLLPKQELIAKAKESFGLDAVLQVVLWVSVDDSNSRPVIGFSSKVIQFLTSVEASIDIDTYRKS